MSNLIQKLRLPAEGRALILNAPEGYLENHLTPLPEGLEVVTDPAAASEEGSFDFVQLFVQSIADLAQFGPQAAKAVKYDHLLWIVYPKKSGKIKTDITRDKGWEPMQALGYDLISLISIDETWSSCRLRPAAEVSSRSRAQRIERGVKNTTTPKGDRTVEVPDDLQQALDKSPAAKELFDSLAYSHRKEYVRWITEAKREATRTGRVQKTIERLEQGLKNPHVKQ